MAAADVQRLFKLRDDVTESSAPAVRRAAVADADRLKTVLRSYDLRIKESGKEVRANGLIDHGYAPRLIYASGPEETFIEYSRPIRDAMGVWYVTQPMLSEDRISNKLPGEILA